MNITIKYGIVSKDGDEIGQIIDEECILLRAIGPTVKAAINAKHGAKLKFVVDDDSKSIAPGVPSGQTENTEGASTSGKPVSGSSATVAPGESVKSKQVATPISGLPRLLELAEAGKIPPPPTHHAAMGDKDPAFVKWFQTHATPDEVQAKYPATRRIPSSFADYERGERERLQRKLKGEKKDTDPSQDFADEASDDE